MQVRDKKAFSLVELLLALVITAIIGVSVYNMFWSAVKLDDRMRRAHDNYMELLMADQALTHDLENAIDLDFSNPYPDAVVFDGKKAEFSFLTQTPDGVKRIRYFTGTLEHGSVSSASTIGRVVNSSSGALKGTQPVEFLLRTESSLSDWLNETSSDTSTQIVAAGLKQGTFVCQYAPYVKDIHNAGAKAIEYKDEWEDKGLPIAVSCSFTLFDSKKSDAGLIFKRDIFLAPVASYHNEQQ